LTGDSSFSLTRRSMLSFKQKYSNCITGYFEHYEIKLFA
jgi:hypothetical protein